MPKKSFQCMSCNHQFYDSRRKADTKMECPECGSRSVINADEIEEDAE